MRIVVVGGSVAGLSVALFAARQGADVVILDSDEATDPNRRFDETVARSPRQPTPQAAHSHAFLSKAHRILTERAPDVIDAFAAHGVESVRLADHLPESLADRSPRPGDDDLIVMRARRSTFEAVLRQVVAAEPGVRIRAGVDVSGLLYLASTSDETPHVVGVETDHGPVTGDVVVDASGRRGRTHTWLSDVGIDVAEQTSDCGISYYTRFYRLYVGERHGELNRGYTAGGSFDRYSSLVFPGDNGSFSVTFGIVPEDKELRRLRHDAAFDAAATSIPVVADWVDRAEPISDARSMVGMKNRLRRLVVRAEGARMPLVTGLFPVADAAGISNPAHSRGCSLALGHAARLADLIVSHHDDGTAPHDTMLAADDLISIELEPWIDDSRRQDEARLSRWRPGGGHVAPATPSRSVTNGQAWTAAHHDRDVWSRFTRLQQLLVPAEEVLEDADTVGRVRAVLDAGLGLAPLAAPDHDQLAELLVEHAPVSARRADLRKLVASA